jgi:hypothetical protein
MSFKLLNERRTATVQSKLSQDDPLLEGYLKTTLTASLPPKAHLKWTIKTISSSSKAVLAIPLSPGIKQRLLIYGANSKIMHTHCLMALSPASITSIDSKLEATCQKSGNYPKVAPEQAYTHHMTS